MPLNHLALQGLIKQLKKYNKGSYDNLNQFPANSKSIFF